MEQRPGGWQQNVKFDGRSSSSWQHPQNASFGGRQFPEQPVGAGRPPWAGRSGDTPGHLGGAPNERAAEGASGAHGGGRVSWGGQPMLDGRRGWGGNEWQQHERQGDQRQEQAYHHQVHSLHDGARQHSVAVHEERRATGALDRSDSGGLQAQLDARSGHTAGDPTRDPYIGNRNASAVDPARAPQARGAPPGAAAMTELPTEQTRKLLKALEPSNDSVVGCSDFLKHWRERAVAVCSVMADAYCEPSASTFNRLAIFYVYNDLVQKYPAYFADAGYHAFLRIIGALVASGNEAQRRPYLRTVAIWQERRVYSSEVAEKLRVAYTPLPSVAPQSHTVAPRTAGADISGLLQSVALRNLLKVADSSAPSSARAYARAKSAWLRVASSLPGGEVPAKQCQITSDIVSCVSEEDSVVLVQEFERALAQTCAELETVGTLAVKLTSAAQRNCRALEALAAKFSDPSKPPAAGTLQKEVPTLSSASVESTTATTAIEGGEGAVKSDVEEQSLPTVAAGASEESAIF